jgi:hypothetical protein
MWIYSTTQATSAASTSLSRSYSESEHKTESLFQTGLNGPLSFSRVSDSWSASTHVAQPLETRQTTVFADTSRATTGVSGTSGSVSTSTGTYAMDQTLATTRNVSAEYATNFSRLLTNWTSAETQNYSYNEAGTTGAYLLTTLATFSSEITFALTRGTYRSGTQTTTVATTGATTVSTAAATSAVSTAAGTTVATATTASSLVSVSTASTITTTTYASGAARTLTEAEAFAEVTEAEASEALWQITATANTAGFVSELGATFTRRTGTLATTSTALPVTNLTNFDVTFSAIQAAAAATVDTTTTTTSVNTYVPFAGVFPATATATRLFTLLSVVSTTIAQSQIASSSIVLNALTTDSAASIITARRTTTAGLPVNWNQSPTVTATALLGLTVATSSTFAGRPTPPNYATSASATVNAGSVASGTTNVSTFTTTSTATTTNISTITGYAFTTFTVFISTASAAGACAIPPATVSASSQTNFAGYTDAETYWTFHNYPSDHTSSTSAVQWQAYTVAMTTMTNVTTTRSTDTTGTRTLSIDYTYYTGSSSTAVEGVSLTYALLHPQATFDGSAQWSFAAFRQSGGFQHPLALGTGDALHTNQPGAGSFGWTDTASQMNRFGAITPALFSDGRAFTSAGTIGTVRFETSDSIFNILTAFTLTYTTATATGTFTSTTSTGTATASLATQTAATYYAPITALAASAGTRIGGQAGNTAFAFTAIIAPGVRHSTTQSAGASASGTSWGTDWLVVSGTSFGLALPTISESAWSITQRLTSWSLFGKSSFLSSTGSTSRPVVALSQYPSN